MQSSSTKAARPSSDSSSDQNPLLGGGPDENEVSRWSPSSSSGETITNEEQMSSANDSRTRWYNRTTTGSSSSSSSTTSTLPILERAAAEPLPASSPASHMPAEGGQDVMMDVLASGPSTPSMVIPDPIPPQYYSRSHSCSIEEQEYFQYESRGGRFLRARARHLIDGASELSKRIGRILKNLDHSGLLDLDRDDGMGRSRTYHLGSLLPPPYQSRPGSLDLVPGATAAGAGAGVGAGTAAFGNATQSQGPGQTAPVTLAHGVHLSRAGRLRCRMKQFGREVVEEVKLFAKRHR